MAKHLLIALYHPYNKTNKEEMATVGKVLDRIVKNYLPMVLEDRDVLHLHKYWWSLFKDIGLHYDGADQFRKAIMVDEFGGNYLDGNGNPGGYTTLKETILRFMGRLREERPESVWTVGCLAKGSGEKGSKGIRYDEVAVQMT